MYKLIRLNVTGISFPLYRVVNGELATPSHKSLEKVLLDLKHQCIYPFKEENLTHVTTTELVSSSNLITLNFVKLNYPELLL